MTRLALLLSLSACSVALQSKPNKTATKECHTSHAYWIADAVIAAAGTAAFVYAVASPGEDIIAAPGGLVGVLYLASAHNGYQWRRECARGLPTHTASR